MYGPRESFRLFQPIRGRMVSDFVGLDQNDVGICSEHLPQTAIHFVFLISFLNLLSTAHSAYHLSRHVFSYCPIMHELVLLQQNKKDCLLCAFLMAIGEENKYDYWKDMIHKGITNFHDNLQLRYPNYSNWNSTQTGSEEKGYYPSDLLRALKLSGRSFVFTQIPKDQKTFTALGKSPEKLLLIGPATESDLKACPKKLKIAESWRGGSLHAVCINRKYLLDPGLKRPQRLNSYSLRRSIRRIKSAYLIKFV